MHARELTPADLPALTRLLDEVGAAIQQHPAWGEVQRTLGVSVRQFGVFEDDDVLVGYAQAIVRRGRLGLSWWQVGRGPVCKFQVSSFKFQMACDELLAHLQAIARRERAVFIRFDWPEELVTSNLKLTTVASHHTNFPETTLVLDLAASEEELLAQMKPKGRYNIRVAEKHGVTVRETTDVAAADVFYDLLKKTTARDGFAGHGRAYYRAFLRILGPLRLASCFVAEHDGQPIAASLVTWWGRVVTYYYGASDHAHRPLMAPYAVQWAAIRVARERGFRTYDFLGIAPEGGGDGHDLAGVTDFKRKFGGRVVNYPLSSEVILRPFIYRVMLALKRLRR